MSYLKEEEIFKRVNEHNQIALDLGYNVLGTFLQGSFNYGDKLSDEQSDIDTKSLIIPSFEDFCLNRKPVSTTHVCENGEHIDLKDFRIYLQTFKKQNVNFVEILFTKYYVLNPEYITLLIELFDRKEEIAHYSAKAILNAICGMALEKQKALQHPYPATKEKIEKFGFDGKQLSHIARLSDFMDKYMAGKPFGECLIPDNPKRLLEIKRNKNISLLTAIFLSSTFYEEMHNKKEFFLKDFDLQTEIANQKEIDNFFNYFSVEVLKQSFKKELML